jgi:hypothetical protein
MRKPQKPNEDLELLKRRGVDYDERDRVVMDQASLRDAIFLSFKCRT